MNWIAQAGWIAALAFFVIALFAVQRAQFEQERRADDLDAHRAVEAEQHKRFSDVHAAFIAAEIDVRELKRAQAERDFALGSWRLYREHGERLKADGYTSEVARDKHLVEAELDKMAGYAARIPAPPVSLVRAVSEAKEAANG